MPEYGANYKLIGKDYTTADLHAKVTGRAKYAEDYRAEGNDLVRTPAGGAHTHTWKIPGALAGRRDVPDHAGPVCE